MIGKDVDIHDRAPKAWLTGVSWNWGPMMEKLVEEVRAGTWKPSHVRGNLASGAAVFDPFGASVPEDVRRKVLAAEGRHRRRQEGRLDRPDRPSRTARRPRRPARSCRCRPIETMDYLVKGVIGSAK